MAGIGPVSLALDTIPELYQIGKGIVDERKANSLQSSLGKLYYDIPQSRREALGVARTNAGSRMFSGQDYAEGEIDESTGASAADIVRASSSGVDAIAGITGVDASTKRAKNQIAFKAAEDYNKRLGELSYQLGLMGNEEEKKWQTEKQNPYMAKLAEISAYRYSGDQNRYQGVKGLSNDLAMYSAYKSLSTPGANTSGLPAAAPMENPGTGTPPAFSPEQMYYLDMINNA